MLATGPPPAATPSGQFAPRVVPVAQQLEAPDVTSSQPARTAAKPSSGQGQQVQQQQVLQSQKPQQAQQAQQAQRGQQQKQQKAQHDEQKQVQQTLQQDEHIPKQQEVQPQHRSAVSAVPINKASDAHMLDDPELEENQDCLFLSGVHLHLCCCTPQEQLQLVRIAREGCALRHAEMSSSLTHIVVS